ncbi:MAG: methylmalonyl-CoA epimerase [Planctomycetota bacterium]|jgi:methylmalonyl-CoA/ethylmalonyl-CoA epimerase|nr:methylmalonyl-CoA epimerase [Planctomycetota bacterium]MDP6941875.1 methylmalonyl-CoA epimerase [Planctomycetota bacterium]
MNQIQGIDHIAIVVEDLDAALEVWRDRLGLREGKREVVDDQGVEIQMMYAGKTRVELVCPLSSETPIQAWLEKNGPGLHHLALAVRDCSAAIQETESAGARMIDSKPRSGAHGTNIAFVHPKSTGGVLTEFVEGGEE